MKRILLFILTLFTSAIAMSQVSYGKEVQFPDKSLFGSAYKPKLSIGQVKNGDILSNAFVLHFISPDDYADFDNDSRLLIKFDDGSKYTLYISSADGVERDYSNIVSKYSVAHCYSTYSLYQLPDSILQKIILETNKIIKIRVVFTNGDIKDYEIDEYYQSKFLEKLHQSYEEAKEKNIIRSKNMDDSDF